MRNVESGVYGFDSDVFWIGLEVAGSQSFRGYSGCQIHVSVVLVPRREGIGADSVEVNKGQKLQLWSQLYHELLNR